MHCCGTFSTMSYHYIRGKKKMGEGLLHSLFILGSSLRRPCGAVRPKELRGWPARGSNRDVAGSGAPHTLPAGRHSC